jgi:hypothetical protein
LWRPFGSFSTIVSAAKDKAGELVHPDRRRSVAPQHDRTERAPCLEPMGSDIRERVSGTGARGIKP